MQKQLLITVTGNDRVGIVEDVTKIILAYQGNVDASRMAHLGGEFAMLMLVSVSEEHLAHLQEELNGLSRQGFDLSTRPTERSSTQKFDSWHSYQINVRGADHEGIIHEISRHLAQQAVNVETIDTGTEDAPFGGMLFTMSATVLMSPTISLAILQEGLEAVGDQFNVDINIEPLAD
jgi:glycine cleavage system transcriptional repressor